MSGILGSPALRQLARMKLRGTLRRQWRRLHTPKGVILTALGLSLFGLWIASIVFSAERGAAPPNLDVVVSLMLLALSVLSLSGAFVHRGLFVPREEIERLFSAPASRSDLVRYRLWVNVGRGMLGSCVIGLLVVGKLPQPLLGFAALLLTLQTLPLVHQLVAILAGTLEKRLQRSIGVLRALLVLAGMAAFVPLLLWLRSDGDPDESGTLGFLHGIMTSLSEPGGIEHPLLRALSLPLLPWARMIVAPSVPVFLGWFAFGALFWVVLFELTARLPVDFREISLDTSASVAARLRRAQRGGGAASSGVTRQTLGWKVPWILGRGPAGAIAWRKCGAILRKAKGTLWVSILVLGFVTIFASVMEFDSTEAPLLFIAGLGTLYLCAGLRFDFRDELERMDVIKAWPLAPWRLFTAMLVPEVIVVSTLLGLAVFARAFAVQEFPALLPVVIALIPLVVFAWVALDNAVFLFAPIRYGPGQDGAVQNVGRGIVMMLMRMVLLAAVIVLAGFPAGMTYWLVQEILELPREIALISAGGVVWGALLLVDCALVLLGGRVLARFDVARDRG